MGAPKFGAAELHRFREIGLWTDNETSLVSLCPSLSWVNMCSGLPLYLSALVAVQIWLQLPTLCD